MDIDGLPNTNPESDPTVLRQSLKRQIETMMSNLRTNDRESVIDQLLFDQQMKLMRYIMKVDVTGQVQYLQKTHSVDLVLREITREQLRIKHMEIERKLENLQYKITQSKNPGYQDAPGSSNVDSPQPLRLSTP